MFSCLQAVRLTIASLERPLSRIERVRRLAHLMICQHCRRHSRQIQGLAFALDSRHHRGALDLPGLSPVARSRIAAAIVEADQS